MYKYCIKKVQFQRKNPRLEKVNEEYYKYNGKSNIVYSFLYFVYLWIIYKYLRSQKYS